jgi:transcriptional regulator of acetoin/glycerol metabolism
VRARGWRADGPISIEHLPDTVRGRRRPASASSQPPAALSEEDERIRDALVAALETHRGNISAVARALGKDRKQIQRWIKRFQVDPHRFRG